MYEAIGIMRKKLKLFNPREGKVRESAPIFQPKFIYFFTVSEQKGAVVSKRVDPKSEPFGSDGYESPAPVMYPQSHVCSRK